MKGSNADYSAAHIVSRILRWKRWFTMTVCVYCRRDINSDGEYEPFECRKIKDKDYDVALMVCEKCRNWIPEGREVPAP